MQAIFFFCILNIYILIIQLLCEGKNKAKIYHLNKLITYINISLYTALVKTRQFIEQNI